MRLTCILCVIILVTLGIFAAVYAFTGFNLLYFLCLGSDVIYRSYLAICGVSALFTIFALLAFKPFRGLR